MYVLLAFEGLLEDEVSLFVVRNHDILVALMGKRPVSSVYSLLIGYVLTKRRGFSPGGMIGFSLGGLAAGGFGLVDRMFWRCCARCPLMVSSASGQ